jgi:hypothetical protein
MATTSALAVVEGSARLDGDPPEQGATLRGSSAMSSLC